jgi:hypothetical protein
MKNLIIILILIASVSFSFAQKSSVEFCKYPSKVTEVKGSNHADTSELWYKGQVVGYIYCNKVKTGFTQFYFENFVFDLNLNKVAMIGMETAQMVIRYFNPNKWVYVKGITFDNLMKQMVEVDKKLKPKE